MLDRLSIDSLKNRIRHVRCIADRHIDVVDMLSSMVQNGFCIDYQESVDHSTCDCSILVRLNIDTYNKVITYYLEDYLCSTEEEDVEDFTGEGGTTNVQNYCLASEL